MPLIEYSCRHDVSMSIYSTSNDNGQMTAWPQGEEYEDRFHYREVPVGRGFLDVRSERISAFYSHAAAYGRCSAVLRCTLRIAVLRGDFSVADSTRGPVARESLRAFGTDDSGSRDFQHTLLSHFHGPCGFAAGCGRYGLVVPYGVQCAVCV